MLLQGCVWLVVVVVVVVAPWHGMRAQEKIARHMEAIERALGRGPSP
jgi:hypothetical protein